jgi:hypothetical protein
MAGTFIKVPKPFKHHSQIFAVNRTHPKTSKGLTLNYLVPSNLIDTM